VWAIITRHTDRVECVHSFPDPTLQDNVMVFKCSQVSTLYNIQQNWCFFKMPMRMPADTTVALLRRNVGALLHN